MALPATENFSNPADDPLTGRAGWSQPGATADSGKAAQGTYQDESGDSDDKTAYWDADTFANNQSSQIELAAFDSGVHRLGVILRAGSGNEALLIRYKSNDGDFEAYYWDSGGTRNALSGNPYTPSATFNAADIMMGEIDGSTLTLKIDFGSGFVTETTWDASSGPSSGSAGIYIVAGNNTVEGDNWVGDDIAAAGTEISASVDTLTLTDNNVTINAETSFATTLESLALTSYPVTVNAETGIEATFDSLALTEYEASIKADTSIAAATDGLTLTDYNATVSLGVNINPTADALALTDFNALINAETNITVGVDSLSLTAFNASVAIGSGGFQAAWARNQSGIIGQGLR